MREQLLWERELLGLCTSSQHPLELFEKFLDEQTVPLNTLKPAHDGKAVTIGGAIVDVREIVTKNGQKMAFVKLEDRYGEVEVILFPGSFQQTLGIWERDKVVLIRGQSELQRPRVVVQAERGEVKIMVDDAREITATQATAYQETGKKRKTPAESKKVAKILKQQPQLPKNRLRQSVYTYASAMQRRQRYATQAQTNTQTATRQHRWPCWCWATLPAKQAVKLPAGIDRDGEGLNLLRELVGAENLKVQ